MFLKPSGHLEKVLLFLFPLLGFGALLFLLLGRLSATESVFLPLLLILVLIYLAWLRLYLGDLLKLFSVAIDTIKGLSGHTREIRVEDLSILMAQLRQDQQRQFSLMDRYPGLHVVLDGDGRIQGGNRQFISYFDGYDWMGKPFIERVELISGAESVSALIDRVLAEEEAIELNRDSRLRLIEQGVTLNVAGSISPIMIEGGASPLGVNIILSDSVEINQRYQKSERVRVEEQVLNTLLSLSLQKMTVETYLNSALNLILTSVTWADLAPKGAIYKSSERGGEKKIEISVSIGVDEDLQQRSKELKIGECLCGWMVDQLPPGDENLSKELPECIAGSLDSHEGAYLLPLKGEKEVLGVLLLYCHHRDELGESHELFFRRLAAIISSGIERHQSEEQFEFEALHDPLTGLSNRRLLREHLNVFLTLSQRYHTVGALVFLDIDHFKEVNETLGHYHGDRLLKEIAGRLQRGVRTSDEVGRIGGDEFVILLRELSSSREDALREVARIVTKIQKSVSFPYLLDGHRYQLYSSVGIVLVPDGSSICEEVLRKADMAMRQAKDSPEDSFSFFESEMQQQAESRTLLESALIEAFKNDQVEIKYIPELSGDGHLIGLSVLPYWNEPDRDLLGGDELCKLAEESGLNSELGSWMLLRAFSDFAHLHQKKISDEVYLTLGMTPLQLAQEDLAEQILELLKRFNLNPAKIEFQFSEELLKEESLKSDHRIESIRNTGVLLGIGKFGLESGSISRLKDLKPDRVRLDSGLTASIQEPFSSAFISAVVQVGNSLQASVIVTGVDSNDLLERVKSIGVTGYQGSLAGSAQTLSEIIKVHLPKSK